MAVFKHIAISLDDISDWCRKNNMSMSQACGKYFGNLNRLIKSQIRLNVPIFTIYLLSDNVDKSTDDYLTFSDFMADFFNDMYNDALISEHKIKISVFGKWYNLPGKAIESLKNLIEETKEYDGFFLNFCINYDGQEEIVDACKLVAKQVELGKLNPEMITKDNIKENIYSSYFLPPDVMFIYGEKKLSGLLLWDSANSNILFADKHFMEFEEYDIEKLNRNLYK